MEEAKKATWIEELKRVEERAARRETRKKIVLALLQQCKDEGLTVDEVEMLCKEVVIRAKGTTLRGGLTIE